MNQTKKEIMYRYSKIICFVSIVVLFTSCKNEKQRENEKLENNLKSFYIENFKDSTSTLDSFRLVEIDTISQSVLLLKQSLVLNNQLDMIIDLYRSNIKSLSNSVDMAKLYAMIESSDLVAIEKKGALEISEKGKKIKAEIDTLQSVIESIHNKVLIADSVKPVSFLAKCFFQVRLKDKSVKRDTVFIPMNLSKDVIKIDDFLNLPYNVDYESLVK